MADPLASIPQLGAGLGYRRDIHADIMRNAGALDYLEIIADNYLYDPRRQRALAEFAERFTIVPHGLNLSIGRADALDREYLLAAKAVSDLCRAPYYSDHLALTSVPGIAFGHLAPLCYDEETLRAVVRNVRHVQDFLEKPLVLENISYDFEIPGATMSQAEFLTRLTARTGCGILLDIANLHINATNHGFDPIAFLDMMPLDHVVQVHLAGGVWHDGRLIDTHTAPVPAEAWALFAELCRRTPVRAAIVERDRDYGQFALLLDEVAQIRRMMTSLPLHSNGPDLPRLEGALGADLPSRIPSAAIGRCPVEL